MEEVRPQELPPPLTPRRRWRIWVLAGGLLLLLASPLLIDGDQFFYYPDATIYATRTDLGFGDAVEELDFESADGTRLHGWWMPAVGTSVGTVVYCHGNHRNLTFHTRYVTWLPTRGFNVLVFDYRGYGKSEGAPDRAGTVADAQAAIDLALTRDPDRTIVFGHSLGGAVGLAAAADRPAVRAVAVESTFSSYRAAARTHAGWAGPAIDILVSAGHEPSAAAARLAPRPLHIIHGTEDTITPVHLARELFAAAREPKSLRIIDGAAHRTAWVDPKWRADFETQLCRFFRDALRRR